MIRFSARRAGTGFPANIQREAARDRRLRDPRHEPRLRERPPPRRLRLGLHAVLEPARRHAQPVVQVVVLDHRMAREAPRDSDAGSPARIASAASAARDHRRQDALGGQRLREAERVADQERVVARRQPVEVRRVEQVVRVTLASSSAGSAPGGRWPACAKCARARCHASRTWRAFDRAAADVEPARLRDVPRSSRRSRRGGAARARRRRRSGSARPRRASACELELLHADRRARRASARATRATGQCVPPAPIRMRARQAPSTITAIAVAHDRLTFTAGVQLGAAALQQEVVELERRMNQPRAAIECRAPR